MILKRNMKSRLARLNSGFTLVELLIVIALLGVIATIVIAAINPIEQANRASDASQKADASQIVSALQRYYTSNSQYPWQVVTPGTYSSSDIAFPFVNAKDPNVGLCSVGGCTAGGELVTSNELQSAFISRSFFKSTSSDGILYVGKGSGSSSTVYVCWIPKSNSDRQKIITSKQVINVSAGFTNGLVNSTSSCDTGPAAPGWTVSYPALPTCGECVPE